MDNYYNKCMKYKTYKGKPTKYQQKKFNQHKGLILIIAIIVLCSGWLYENKKEPKGINYHEQTESVADSHSGGNNEALEQEIELIEVVSETIREITAYNVGDPYQTDDSPCIGASNKNLCEMVENGENICAANFVPFGTKLHITSENGWEMTCVVEDRMNSRYKNRVDIAMSLEEKQRALQFGVQNLNVRILGKTDIIAKK